MGGKDSRVPRSSKACSLVNAVANKRPCLKQGGRVSIRVLWHIGAHVHTQKNKERERGKEERNVEGEQGSGREKGMDRDTFSFTSFGSQCHRDPEFTYFLYERTERILCIMG